MSERGPAGLAGVTGLVLAGGRGARMGGQDKGWVMVGSQPMIKHVIEAVSPQVERIVVNANRNLSRYRALGFPVVTDAAADDFLGPLAGIASGLRCAKTEYLMAVPCDTPLIGPDLARRLFRCLVGAGAEICTVRDAERTHPVFCLMKTALAQSLRDYLDSGERKIDGWFDRHHTAVADFSDTPQMFTNVNRESDRVEVERRLRAYP